MNKLLYTTISILSILLSSLTIQAQDDDLLGALGNEEKTIEYAKYAFKSPRIINGHSIEMLPKGVLDFRILHRFGALSDGPRELFGLDQASMRMAFDYGVTDNLMLGIGRSTNQKEIDAFAKYRILWQSTGKRNMPISLIWASGMTINGTKSPFPQDVEDKLERRVAYYHQLIIGRKFSEKFSFQLAPMLLHRNYTESIVEPNNIYALGVGGRYKVSKRIAITWDTYYPFNGFATNLRNLPISLGVDIETGGHVFQLHCSNAVGMNERAFITDSNGDWLKGNIRLGFNISRWFQLKKK